MYIMSGDIIRDDSMTKKAQIPVWSLQERHTYQSSDISLAMKAYALDWKLNIISVLWNRQKRQRLRGKEKLKVLVSWWITKDN